MSNPAEINLLSNMLNDKIGSRLQVDPNLLGFGLILIFLYLIYLHDSRNSVINSQNLRYQQRELVGGHHREFICKKNIFQKPFLTEKILKIICDFCINLKFIF